MISYFDFGKMKKFFFNMWREKPGSLYFKIPWNEKLQPGKGVCDLRIVVFLLKRWL